MNSSAPDLTVPVSADDHIQGHANAPVTLVEYGDYQCPACGMAYPLIKRIQRESGSYLRFVFRNFPLTNVHPLAHPAAQCAEAAASVSKFWPMHDWLYENQEAWSAYGAEGLEAGLQALGIDESAVARAMRGPKIDGRIHADFMGGVRSGVNGTPCFFINGYRYEGDFGELNVAIADLITRI
ncbi:MAG TPA: DsbA family protein [Noviherbaspirillum sp.]|nr:DsbA family protein [Noviherbaspirillum sp.]